jgi:hypothetical protein
MAGGIEMGITVVRTLVRVVPLTAPALGDSVTLGCIIGRQQGAASDLADPTTAGLTTTDQTLLHWGYLQHFTAAPTYTPGGSNVIEFDLRSRRKISEIGDVWMISIKHGGAVASTYRIFARSLYLLP